MALGRNPIRDNIILTLEADYTLELVAPDGEVFPGGTDVYIKIYKQGKKDKPAIATWNATVTTDTAWWRIESAVADLIKHGSHHRIYVSYPQDPDPTLDHCWYAGEVLRDQ